RRLPGEGAQLDGGLRERGGGLLHLRGLARRRDHLGRTVRAGFPLRPVPLEDHLPQLRREHLPKLVERLLPRRADVETDDEEQDSGDDDERRDYCGGERCHVRPPWMSTSTAKSTR